MTYIYIDPDTAHNLHDYIIQTSWGREWIEIPWETEKVLELMQYYYYPTFEDKLAYLMHKIACNHWYKDWNKRTALELWRYFIDLNFETHLAVSFYAYFENLMKLIVTRDISEDFLKEIIHEFMNWNIDSNEHIKIWIYHATVAFDKRKEQRKKEEEQQLRNLWKKT